MNKISIITIYSIIFFASCTTSTNNLNNETFIASVDSIETDEVKEYIDDNTKSWHAVYLDDSSIDAMVGEIRGVMCDDSLLFVAHMLNDSWEETLIYVYNTEGKFLRSIFNRGRAHNEILYMGDWTINPIDNEVLVVDKFNELLKRYDYNGNFIGSYQLDGSLIPLSNIFVLDSSNFLFQMMMLDEPSEDYILYSIDGTTKPLFKRRKIYTEESYYGALYYCHDITSTNSYYFSRYFDNKIYKMDSLGNVEIFLELGFITPYKNKYLSPLDEDSDYFWPYINDLYDLKDYILIITKDFGRFIINKETKEIKRYTAKGYDSANMKTPLGIKIVGLHQNLVIEYTDQISAGNYLDYITDEYQPNVVSFYKKAAANENATLVFYEIGK
ncbi:MAG: 6-bladed beta-propeller [Bacteroidaceae bacterium]|nr:6-bladed beta-propeller [Bacteroidaceae bacterium]